jgi:hypothetical protein
MAVSADDPGGTTTKQVKVEKGRQSPSIHRDGPYADARMPSARQRFGGNAQSVGREDERGRAGLVVREDVVL